MDSFYRDFENKHRGSRELICSRFEVYLPFVVPCKELTKKPKVIDLGCGRGEWIEMMAQMGMDAEGVDLNDGMLNDCRELGLNVVKADILDYLKVIESESVSIVSAFHVVEHLPFDLLCSVVKEIFRILIPGGLLLFETPNSENILVGTSNFYMDPTHQKPLPAALLSFVVEYTGFDRVKVLYLQESLDVMGGKNVGLFSVLSGSSADYGIVAQKKSSPQIMMSFDAVFSREYGIRLENLASQYDLQIKEKFSMLENRLNAAEAAALELKKEMSLVKNESAHFERMMHHWWQVADKVERASKKSAPVRRQNFFSRGKLVGRLSLPSNPASYCRHIIRRVVLKPIRHAYAVPWIRKPVLNFISRFPRLRNFLRRIIYSHEQSSANQRYIANHEGLSRYETRIYRLIVNESKISSGKMHENRD